MERKDMIKRIAVAGGMGLYTATTSIAQAVIKEQETKTFKVLVTGNIEEDSKVVEKIKKFTDENPDIKIIIETDTSLLPSTGIGNSEIIKGLDLSKVKFASPMDENPIPRKDRHGKFVAVTPRQKTGRNALCSCKSGLKAKKCCKNYTK